MRNLFLLLLIVSLGVMAGCGSNSKENASEPVVEKDEQVEQVAADNDHNDHDAVMPVEPSDDEKCSMCDMEVYHQHDEMGMFTGQVMTADGEHLFTDDVGCLMNQIRTLDEKPLGAWVRDYNTLEWVPVDQAFAVKADIQTPMKMGFALFGTEDSANKFIQENDSLHPMLSSVAEIDKIAEERMKAKMEKMKSLEEKEQGQMDGHNTDDQMDHNMDEHAEH